MIIYPKKRRKKTKLEGKVARAKNKERKTTTFYHDIKINSLNEKEDGN